ncbi:coxsackievirus and adenovirus receptor homolog [Archocentrus centrarchus]|uniref:coxsackievirus and adenovirus receptor homolog n=1 Tax=Archocentrus centrarchus TaxID=63155 RepID=UPI0011EA27EB|nr:coxsackievirus and adenovirus receptor homolog [Archocentrus centrarchus]
MNLTATEGQTVTLPCRAPNNKLLVAIEWSRPDLKQQYVYLSVDDHTERLNQHPSFKDRVILLDRQMKDGDVSLVLINVTTDDTGTYECRVETRTNSRRATLDAAPISIIYLRVDPPGQPGGSAGPTAGLSAIVCLLLLLF